MRKIKDLAGAVIPNSKLFFFQLFFPGGWGFFSYVFYVLIVCIGIFLINMLISALVLKIYVKREDNAIPYYLRKKTKFIPLTIKVLITTVAGFLNPFLFGVFTQYFIMESLYIIIKTLEYTKKRKPKLWKKPFKLLLVILFELNLIINCLILPVVGFIAYFLMNLQFALYFGFGTIFSILLVIISQLKLKRFILGDIIPFNINKHKPKLAKILTISLITLPILFTGAFYLTWFDSHEAPPEQPGPLGSNHIKIITYNIRNGQADDGLDSWKYRKDNFIDQIISFDADIFGFQEAYLSQINDIVEGLNSETALNRQYEWTGAGREDGIHGGEHTPIVWDSKKYNLLDTGNFWLKNNSLVPGQAFNNTMPRVATWVRFEIIENKTQFVVYNTHYGFGDFSQHNAGVLIGQKLKEYSGNLPAFLIGDFNMVEGVKAFDSLTMNKNKPINDAFGELYDIGPHLNCTFNSFEPTRSKVDRKIDFIFISSDINVNSCNIDYSTYIDDGIERCFSDHYPVIAECQF